MLEYGQSSTLTVGQNTFMQLREEDCLAHFS